MNKTMRGAWILTMGILVSRALGILFVFPFSKMVGAAGVSLFTYAYVPYAIFIDLSTLGIPLGISKIVASYQSVNDDESSYKILKKAIVFMTLLGIVSFILMNLFKETFARIVLAGKDELTNNVIDVENVISYISFSLLLIPIISVLRGFLQGKSKMLPTAISQIIEQIIRVTVILIGSYIVISNNGDYVKAVNIAVFASFFGALGALFCLLIFFFKNYQQYEKVGKKVPFSKVFKYAIPYALFGLLYPMIQLIDSLTYNKALLHYGIADPESYYGVYAFEVQKLIFIPISIAIGISGAIMPTLTNYCKKKEQKNINLTIEKAFKTIFILLPIEIFMIVFSNEIYYLFYNLEFGPSILKIYALVIIFLGLNNMLVGTLQGINLGNWIYFAILSGILFKSISNYYMISVIGPNGAIFSTLVSLMISVFILLFGLFRNKYFKIKRFIQIFTRTVILSIFPTVLVIIIKNKFVYEGGVLFYKWVYLIANAFLFLAIFFSLNALTNKNRNHNIKMEG